MFAGIFTVDLRNYEDLCATVPGCSFDKSAYVPYAFGFSWQLTNPPCNSADGPYIYSKGGSLPLKGLSWNNVEKYVTIFPDAFYYYEVGSAYFVRNEFA